VARSPARDRESRPCDDDGAQRARVRNIIHRFLAARRARRWRTRSAKNDGVDGDMMCWVEGPRDDDGRLGTVTIMSKHVWTCERALCNVLFDYLSLWSPNFKFRFHVRVKALTVTNHNVRRRARCVLQRSTSTMATCCGS